MWGRKKDMERAGGNNRIGVDPNMSAEPELRAVQLERPLCIASEYRYALPDSSQQRIVLGHAKVAVGDSRWPELGLRSLLGRSLLAHGLEERGDLLAVRLKS